MADLSNVSSNQLTLTLSILPVLPNPLTIEGFSADSDIWQVDDVQTADAQTTPDGKDVFWSLNNRIPATLTLSSASPQAKILSNLLQAQSRYGQIPAVLSNVTAVLYNSTTEETETFINGVMTQGAVGTSYGNQKKKDKVFQFSFGKRI